MRILVLGIILFIGILHIKPYLSGPDAYNYYIVAKTISSERNLMFDTMPYPMTISPTYHVIEYHNIGISLIWMFLADLLKNAAWADEAVFMIFINLIEYLFGLLSLFFMFKIALKFFERRVVLLSVLAVLFGTNLFGYITFLSGSSHLASILFVCAFLLFYINTRGERNGSEWFILGSLLGFAILIRGEAFLYLVFPAYDIYKFIRSKKIREAALRFLLFASGLIISSSPQLIFRQIVYGRIFAPFAEADYFTGLRFMHVLFHYTRGFFFFSPLVGTCFLSGLIYLRKKDRQLSFGSLFIFLGIVFIAGIRKFSWDAGSSFSGRYFLICSPLFVISLAASFEKISLAWRFFVLLVNGIWTTWFLMLWFFQGDFYPSASIYGAFTIRHLYEAGFYIYRYLINKVPEFFSLKFLGLLVILLSVKGLYTLLRGVKIPLKPIKNIAVYLIVGIVLYINIVLVQCYFNDKVVIEKLKREGFYRDAVFGSFHKYDVAEEYFASAGEARDRKDISSALNLTRRARILYPPQEKDYFSFYYDIWKGSPYKFAQEFNKIADVFDYLGLSLIFLENGDRNNAGYYYRKAISARPDIIEEIRNKRGENPYLYDNAVLFSDLKGKGEDAVR